MTMSRLLLLLCLMCAVTAARADDYLAELVTAAREARLADEPGWHYLLHYRSRPLGGVKSEADDPAFFNAPDGKTGPAAELEATLAAFFSTTVETDTVQNPQCRFVARYRWLRERLRFDPARLPEQPCERYARWRGQLDPASVTLVFPTAFLNSPASMYGHTLLRVDGAGQDERTRLLAYSISFAAETAETNGFAFAWNGLFGGYPGRYSMIPYYLKVAEYSDLESRDIWEYELDLAQPEIERLLEHVWELGPTRFDYYFLDENCAYQLLGLLDVARPSLRLAERFPLWAIPAETVRAVTATPGLVRRAVFRPARSTELQHAASGLSAGEFAAALDLAAGRREPGAVRDTPGLRPAPVLDLAYDYLEFRRIAKQATGPEVPLRLRSLLIARSQVDGAAPEPVPVPEVRADQGHLATRLSIGAGTSAGQGFQELRLRPAYHDLLDPRPGYRDGAQIEFVDMAARHVQGERISVERITFIDVTSIAPRDALIRPVSWKADIGVERTRFPDGSVPLLLHANVGVGMAKTLPGGVLGYAMAEVALVGSERLQPAAAPGVGASVGLVAEPHPRWRVRLAARTLHYAVDTPRERNILSVDQSFRLDARWSLRVEASRRHEFGAGWSTVGAWLLWYF